MHWSKFPQQARSLLCLNGSIPAPSFFERYQNLTLVASDGAGCRLAKMGFPPTLVVGDFDSFSGVQVPGCTYVHNKDQNTTDFDKCLLEMKHRELFPALVTGIAGGALDHSLYAVARFTLFSTTHSMVFFDPHPADHPTWGIPIHEQKILLLPYGCLVSLVCFAPITVSTTGLQWNLQKTELKPGGLCCIRNRAVQEQVSFCVSGSGLLVLVAPT